MTTPDNVYETPSRPVGQEDVQKLQKKVLIGLIFLAIYASIATGIAIYAATRDLGSDLTSQHNPAGNNGLSAMDSNRSRSACSKVKCENQGTCINIYPDNYMCACVATFYGRRCEHGESYYSMSLYLKISS